MILSSLEVKLSVSEEFFLNYDELDAKRKLSKQPTAEISSVVAIDIFGKARVESTRLK
jgi:hypothetical protein